MEKELNPFNLTGEIEESAVEETTIDNSIEENITEEQEEVEETPSAIILKQYIEDGLVDYSEDVDPNLSGSDLMSILSSSAYSKAERTLEDKGYTKENREIIEMLRAGSSEEDIRNFITTQTYSTIEIANDDDLSNREMLIKAYHKDKGISEKQSQQLYDIAVANDETYEEATEAKEYFANKEESLIADAREREKLSIENQEKERIKIEEEVNSILSSGQIGDLPISKYEANNLKKFISENTEPIKYTDERGQERVIKVSKMYLAQMEYEKNLEWQLKFAKFLMDGFKMDKVVKTAKSDRDKETLDVLNGKISKTKAIAKSIKTSSTGTNNQGTIVGEFII